METKMEDNVKMEKLFDEIQEIVYSHAREYFKEKEINDSEIVKFISSYNLNNLDKDDDDFIQKFMDISGIDNEFYADKTITLFIHTLIFKIDTTGFRKEMAKMFE